MNKLKKLNNILNFQEANDMEFVPIAPMDEILVDKEEELTFPEILPIIALKNTVLFPSVLLPINASRNKSVEAIKDAQAHNALVGVVTQKDAEIDEPNDDDLFRIGTIAKVMKQINLPDGNQATFILGRKRFRIIEIIGEQPFLQAKVEYLNEIEPKEDKNQHFQAQVASIKELADKIINLSPNLPAEAAMMIKNINSNRFLINYIGSNIDNPVSLKQQLLEQDDLAKRADQLILMLQNDLQIAELKNEINLKTKGEMDKQQREYFLQQQLKSIKDELEGGFSNVEVKELIELAKDKKWPKHAQEAFQKGIERLEKIHVQAPDFSIHYNQLKLMVELPWDETTQDDFDLVKAGKILDKDHFGLDKIKDRILEYLAVLKLKGDLKSPILCFLGPPGIGKTSLGQSIASAINRKYVRISLGGLHDESELRGHRKTYIGAMPGRIIQSIKKANSSNPVFILDEIEKMGKDFRGDPSSALLEILDPEQNHSFYDNYLETEYDLSKVMFIATANSINDIQPALRDRMEIIQLNGYSMEEKVEIAKKHLIQKQKEAHGLSKYKFSFTKEALELLIHGYTRESGVRELDRMIAAMMRFVAKKIAMNESIPAKIDSETIKKALGVEKYNYDAYKKDLPAGVSIGLAWTSVGGDILFIESTLSKGKGNLMLTGNLGEVMKESAKTALSYLKSHATELGLNPEKFETSDVHIHVPEGAIPKDGPSAGITILTALASSFSGKKVKPFLAMTGEITLRGQVLPVGGIKEKVLAAKRGGIKTVMLCNENKKDIQEINPAYIKGLNFIYVEDMQDVINNVLSK